ncbi:MAG: enoyl-CoA hydratase/isomerase family protein [Gammaproteobacteria bacterium]
MSAVVYRKDGRIAWITINRPEAMNAYNTDVLVGLEEAFLDFQDDEALLVAIFTGAGERAFCAGHDLKQMVAKGDAKKSYARPDGRPIKTLTHGLHLDKPIIAAVNGYCLAGGFDMALACDIRLCSPNATFGFPMVKRGLTGGGGLYFLPQQMPMGWAMEMALTGDPIDADTALRIGLVNRIVPLAELQAEAEKLAHRICDNAPLAVRGSKETIVRVLNEPFEQGLRITQMIFDNVARSEDAREGPLAWTERRKPQWKGR